MVHVLVQADDADDVGPRGHAPVELHLPPGLGAVIQNLGKQSENQSELSLLRVNTLLEVKKRKLMKTPERKNEKQHTFMTLETVY